MRAHFSVGKPTARKEKKEKKTHDERVFFLKVILRSCCASDCANICASAANVGANIGARDGASVVIHDGDNVGHDNVVPVQCNNTLICVDYCTIACSNFNNNGVVKGDSHNSRHNQ